MKNNNNIKIKDKFYRYIDIKGVFEYIVVGIRDYGDDKNYELECQNCSHGGKCVLLCSLDDSGNLIYIRMANDDWPGEESWHEHAGIFHPTKEKAMIGKLSKLIYFHRDNMLAAQKQYEYNKEKMEDFEKQREEFKKLLEKKNGRS